MTPLPDRQDIPSWVQLISAIEDADAGRGTARLIEICLSAYSALATAQFQIAQLQARVHVLATSRPGGYGSAVTGGGWQSPQSAGTSNQPTAGNWPGRPASRS